MDDLAGQFPAPGSRSPVPPPWSSPGSRSWRGRTGIDQRAW